MNYWRPSKKMSQVFSAANGEQWCKQISRQCFQHTVLVKDAIGASVGSGHVRTGCVHERLVEAEGEKRLLEAPQEVLEETSDGVDVVHLAEHGDSFAPQELFLQLLDGAIRTRQTVQSSLTKERTQQFNTLCSASNPPQVKSKWETTPTVDSLSPLTFRKIGNRGHDAE